MIVLVLLAAIGGVGYVFGRQYLPFMAPAAQDKTESSDEAAANKKESSSSKKDDDVMPAANSEDTSETVEVKLVAAGDVIMNNAQIIDSGRKDDGTYDYTHFFANIKRELINVEMRTLSQETALAGPEYPYGQLNPLNAPQELGLSEVASGFNLILHATDHALDTHENGLTGELKWWHTSQPYAPIIGVAAEGISDYVNKVFTYEKMGVKVALLNHTWGVEAGKDNYVSPLTEEKVKADVKKARDEGAQIVIACPHWGRENDSELSEEETTFAKLYSDLGVDVIVGTHPRKLQRVEVLTNAEGHKTVCFYSLGCLVSSLDVDNLIGGLAEITMTMDKDGNVSVTDAVLKPIVTHRADGINYSVFMASEYTDELAASSNDPVLTPDYINSRCAAILGEDYNPEAHELHVTL